jgi:hypothetical protein
MQSSASSGPGAGDTQNPGSHQELPTGKHWTVSLYMINIEGTDTDITPKKNHVDRLSLKSVIK